MIKQPNKARIGFFVLLGMLILAFTAFNLIQGHVKNADEEIWVMFFDESVKGLSVGSPVVFRGVEIGKVSKIQLDVSNTDLTATIPVFVKLSPNHNLEEEVSPLRRKQAIELMIEKGLRARLITQSYLTGQLMIEMEMMPGTELKMNPHAPKDIIQIPTVLSPSGELSKSLSDLPIKDIVDKLDKIMTSLDKQMPVAQAILETIGKTVDKNAGRFEDIIVNVNSTLLDIRDMSKSFKNMADYLERHPESLLKGKEGY